MAKMIRRKKKEFKCGVCGYTEDRITPSEYSLKDGLKHKPLCATCAAAMRFSTMGNYTVVGHEIRFNWGRLPER